MALDGAKRATMGLPVSGNSVAWDDKLFLRFGGQRPVRWRVAGLIIIGWCSGWPIGPCRAAGLSSALLRDGGRFVVQYVHNYAPGMSRVACQERVHVKRLGRGVAVARGRPANGIGRKAGARCALNQPAKPGSQTTPREDGGWKMTITSDSESEWLRER